MRSHRPVALVTGATGFLGSAIAVELLTKHEAVTPLFLVRAPDAHAGLERLRQSLAKLDVPVPALNRMTRDMIVCADLQSFPSVASDSRVQAVTHVLNCAAFASFAWKPEIWEVNVEHTSVFARSVAQLPGVERFLHVGTAMISGKASHCVVQEDEVLDGRTQLVPYTRSKAEIEMRLPGLLGRVPLVVARPSVVVGHTRVGCRASPSIFWIFRLIHLARMVPFSAESRLDIVPVDWCASALASLLLKDTLQSRCYHISAGPGGSRSFEQINQAYCRARGEAAAALGTFDPQNMDEVETVLSEWFDEADLKRVAGAVRVYRAFAGLDVCFDNCRLLAEGIAPAPCFTDYLDVCVRTGEGEPVTEQMVYDFR